MLMRPCRAPSPIGSRLSRTMSCQCPRLANLA